MGELVVKLPLPPRELSPNHYIGSRGGRLGKAAKAKAYRERARHEAGIAAHLAGLTAGGWTRARIQIAWHHPTKRYPDRDNIIAWLKAAIDGVRDSGLLADDDEVDYPSPLRAVDKLNPRVELTITKIESEAANG